MHKIKIVIAMLFLIPLFFACNEEGPVSSDSQVSSDADFSEQFAKRGGSYAEFEITIENLTPATGPGASQPFSPPVIATHTPLFKIFKLGQYASDELRQLAEDAVNGPMINSLTNSDFVFDVVEGSGGPIFPGTSQTFTIKTQLPFIKLSLVSMLVNTNDAFVAANSVRLPLFGSRDYYLRVYDAGTERNTESAMHIPGPCCGSPHVRVPTYERIRFHEGIQGYGNLDPAVYGWDEPAAKLTITRIK